MGLMIEKLKSDLSLILFGLKQETNLMTTMHLILIEVPQNKIDLIDILQRLVLQI